MCLAGQGMMTVFEAGTLLCSPPATPILPYVRPGSEAKPL